MGFRSCAGADEAAFGFGLPLPFALANFWPFAADWVKAGSGLAREVGARSKLENAVSSSSVHLITFKWHTLDRSYPCGRACAAWLYVCTQRIVILWSGLLFFESPRRKERGPSALACEGARTTTGSSCAPAACAKDGDTTSLLLGVPSMRYHTMRRLLVPTSSD